MSSPSLEALTLQQTLPSPLLVIVSGPAGVGKDVTLRKLQAMGASFHFLVTNTTRPRREQEQEGIDYHFITLEEFQAKLARGEFLESANVYGNWYGNSRREIQAALARGQDVIMRIDVQGSETIRRKVKDAIFIFLTASPEELERRLRARHTETEQELQERLSKSRGELAEADKFDYIIPNIENALESTAEAIGSIIRAEKLRAHPRVVEFLDE